jgi:hypothetical protein
MDAEQRMEALEDEFQAEKEGLKRILLEIRCVLMEAQSPLRAGLDSAMPASPDNSGLRK